MKGLGRFAASRQGAHGTAHKAVKELLELIQNELLDADLEREQVQGWTDDVRRFTERDEVRTAMASLFLDPDYVLDPSTFVRAWQKIKHDNHLPDEFSWQRVVKRFARKVAEIRQTSGELKETFDSLATARMSDDIRQLIGLPPEFDLETYREAMLQRFGNLDFGSLDTTGAYYSDVRLLSVFVPQSVREGHDKELPCLKSGYEPDSTTPKPPGVMPCKAST